MIELANQRKKLKIQNKNQINNFEIKINELNKDINSLKTNNILNSNDSTIIEKNEFDMIYSAIKERMNKEIKEIKKIYQATRDGGDSETFHKLCDGISNTLVLYKSEGNRRFGAYVSENWKTGTVSVIDKNCFLFSLDKRKIYYSKNNSLELVTSSFDGPSFTDCKGYYIIEIDGNALKGKNLKTNEKGHKDLFGGDEKCFI